MIWTLIKIFLFIAIVAAVVYGVDVLNGQSQGMQIAVANYEFTLGPLQAVVAALLLLAVVWLVLFLVGLLVACLRFLAGDETAITRYFSRNRERRGYKALADSLTALAAGDPAQALARANKAQQLLRREDLTNLIAAQAAEMSGNRTRATEAYKRLLADDKTRFVGVRGLMKQKLSEGDTETALKLAEKAFVLKPKHDEVSDALLQLQAKHSNWRGARKTLGAKLKYGSIPRDLHKRRDAVLAVSESQHRREAGDLAGSRDEAIEAQRLAPTLVPAAVAAAQAFIEMGKPRNAAKAIKTAWASEPHPELAAAFAEIAPDETPAERLKRFGELAKQNPKHPETKMLLAELNIAAENFPAARRAMGNLAETDPTKRSLTLMAAIERGEGSDDSIVKAWLAKALTASPGPQWICEVDGKAYPTWRAMTDGGFDTLSWKTAPASEVMSGNAAEMLPLIVGALEQKTDVTEVNDAEVVDATPQGEEITTDADKERQATVN